MDFVARAKALLASKARLGLLILPLAAAVPAMASSLPTSNFACDQDNGGTHSSCTAGSAVQQLALLNGIQGLKFFGPSSGAYIFTDGNSGGVSFTTSGFLTGGGISGGTVIPFSYNFDLTNGGCCDFNAWTLTFTILQLSGGFATATMSNPSQTVAGNNSGTGSIVVSSSLIDGLDTVVASTLTLFYGNDGFSGSLVIPSNSLDINPNAPSDVPEPATAGLAGLGILLAGGYRLIRRRKSYTIVKDSK